jgi:hypothetical protein
MHGLIWFLDQRFRSFFPLLVFLMGLELDWTVLAVIFFIMDEVLLIFLTLGFLNRMHVLIPLAANF